MEVAGLQATLQKQGAALPGLVHNSAAAASCRCIAAQQLPPGLEPGCCGAEAAADGSADDRGWSDNELLARLDEVLLPGKLCMVLDNAVYAVRRLRHICL